jgi:hypothetical protein
VFATTADGRPVTCRVSAAVCWCLTGAFGRVLDAPALGFETQPVRHFFADFVGSEYVENWNDAPGRTQPEVVAKLREAAAKAREQGL